MIRFASILILLSITFLSCKKDDDATDDDTTTPPEDTFFSQYESRNFSMGFTSWPYGPDAEDVSDSYSFLAANGDIYTEHVDNSIPWEAWINDLDLPTEFVNEIAFKKSNKISGIDFLLSVSVLNIDRSDLANDFDGQTPEYTSINDPDIVEAYYKHIDYLVTELEPTYLVISIEANELLINSPEKWEGYQLMIADVTNQISTKYPSLMISESMTLHNLYSPDIADVDAYLDEVIPHMNNLDFVTISFYPFFKQQHTIAEYQAAFDFLHSGVSRPIAFVETAHLAEDLSVTGLDLFITGNETEQNEYLQTLLINAQEQNYEFIIWWAHRDFDELWETFPEEVKDLGKLWRDTGLLDEDGESREAYDSWLEAFGK